MTPLNKYSLGEQKRCLSKTCRPQLLNSSVNIQYETAQTNKQSKKTMHLTHRTFDFHWRNAGFQGHGVLAPGGSCAYLLEDILHEITKQHICIAKAGSWTNSACNVSEFRSGLTNCIVVGGENSLELWCREGGAVDGAQRVEVFCGKVWRSDTWRDAGCHAEFHFPLENAVGLFREWHLNICWGHI